MASRRRTGSVCIADVARIAGVSTATVSRVLANRAAVRPQTQALVRDAIRRSGFTPNGLARNLRTRRAMTLLAVVPNLANPVFAQLLRGIDDEITRSGYGLIIGHLDNSPDREARYVDLALSHQIDGVFLMTGRVPRSTERAMTEAELPMVSMCAQVPGLRAPAVVVQDREGGREAALFLCRHGHRHFGYIAGPDNNSINYERFAGFIEGLQLAGFRRTSLVRWNGHFTFVSGVAAAEQFLQLRRRPTGVFAACDASAFGFMKTVRSAGVRVPEDVSLIGFDGTEIADYVEPALTTFRQPLYEVGRMGAEVLLGIIAGTVAQDHSLFRMPVTFLGRGTAGAAPDLAMERHGDEARG